jgi:indoleamine 2,3-dioxygenase
VKGLRTWRSKHIAIVSKYIIRPAQAATCVGQSQIVEANDKEKFNGDEIKGTGGSALVPFLQQARDETIGLDLQIGND